MIGNRKVTPQTACTIFQMFLSSNFTEQQDPHEKHVGFEGRQTNLGF